jgi:hypothetical protein
MLAVESGDDLAGVEIGERQDGHFRKPECAFDEVGDAFKHRVLQASAQDRRHIDLDGDAVGANQKMGAGALLTFRKRRSRDSALDAGGNPAHRSIDGGQRFRILPFDVSFLGREDRDLTNVRGTGKLQQELPGILNWALVGLARLRENGRFMDCPESDAAKIRMLRASEPIKGFVEEKCELGDDVHIDKALFYSRYRAYCRTVGERPMAANKFAERLLYLYPTIGAAKRSASDGSRPPIFDGIRLNEREAAKLYRLALGYIEEDVLMFGFDHCAALDDDGEPIQLTTLEVDFTD